MSAFPLGLLISGETVRIMELVADIHPMTKPCMCIIIYEYTACVQNIGKSFVSTHAVIKSFIALNQGTDRALCIYMTTWTVYIAR